MFQYFKHCDRVVVMEDGEIVEMGLHDVLLAADDKYTEMMRIFDKTTMKSTLKKSNCICIYVANEHNVCVFVVVVVVVVVVFIYIIIDIISFINSYFYMLLLLLLLF